MDNFSKTSLSPVDYDGDMYNYTFDDMYKYGDPYNDIRRSNNDGSSSKLHWDFKNGNVILFVFMLCTGIIGLVGNGAVIYLLGFRIKRSPFTTFILNLAVADSGVLLTCNLYYNSDEITWYLVETMISTESCCFEIYLLIDSVLLVFLEFPYAASQLLLTAISIDRCVCVLFPIWHRCHRPPHLSAIVCALMWVLSFLISVTPDLVFDLGGIRHDFCYGSFLAGALLCLPLVTVSTMILLFKMFCKPQQRRRGRLLTIVLLTLLFFLIFAFPLSAIYTDSYFNGLGGLEIYGLLCASLNSCINPVIYFMVGRKSRGQQRQSLKVILQRAFKEEEEHRAEPDITAETSL